MIGLYRHKNDNAYALLYTATHTETLEKLAVYKALYGDGNVWCQPLEMFMDGGRSLTATNRGFTPIDYDDLTTSEWDAVTTIPGYGSPS